MASRVGVTALPGCVGIFFSTLKNELLWGNSYADRQQARTAFFE